MDNTLKPMSYTEQMQDSLFSWKTPIPCNEGMSVANFHGQASDTYAAWLKDAR